MDKQYNILFIFDLDGTIADTFDDITAAVNHALEPFQLPPLNTDTVRRFVGNGLKRLIEDIADYYSDMLPDGRKRELVEQGPAIWLQYYEKHPADMTRLYPGVEKVLKTISENGARKAILTNKPHDAAVEVVRNLGIHDLFDKVKGQRPGEPKKPDPAPVKDLMKQFETEPGLTVIIGDGIQDIRAGKAAGCVSCGVTYGLSGRSDLVDAGADFIAEKPEEILNYKVKKEKIVFFS